MLKFTRVSSPDDANADSIIVTLFRCRLKMVRGWMVGPISMLRDGVKVPYVPPSAQMLGITAILRASSLAEEAGLPVTIVDPDNLWDVVMKV